jgi:hypothetical protein
MMISRESPLLISSVFADAAAAKPSNHSLAVAGLSPGSFASAFMMLASSVVLTSVRKLDKGGGACISF